MNEYLRTIFDLITVAAMLFGMFFMVIGVLGLWRLPDFYNRTHAATKCVTLGIAGVLVAAAFHLSLSQSASAVEIITKSVLVIIFQFVGNPVGAHLLAKAAHLDGAPLYKGTIGDDLDEDKKAG
jgi:multicomponent Na+:H+ antiporter subunit G